MSSDPAAAYRGQNADANLERLLPACRALKPDGIVLSGDISEDASPDSYRRVVKLLDGVAEKIAWLPGNHDERAAMADIFDPAGFSPGPIIFWGGWQIVLLDSAVPDRPEGHVDSERLRPLDNLNPDSPALVFIHHQPMPVGAAWIDKYPLVEAELFTDRLDPGIIRAIGFGHVHQVFSGQLNGITCLSAPSTVANSQPATERFTPDPTGPKARWFRVWPDGQWQTGIVSAG